MTEYPFASPGAADEETTYAQGRLPDRTYASRGFPINVASSRDYGQPARFVYKVFDSSGQHELTRDGEEWLVAETEAGRYQFKLLVARDSGRVKDLWVQRIPAPDMPGKAKTLLHFSRDDAARLIDLLKVIDSIPVSGDVPAVRVDEDLLRDIFANPDSVSSIYREDPARFRSLITNDESARDVVAVAHRRAQVEHFRRLLEDDDFFDSQVLPGRGPEGVWQAFIEHNPWILGLSLGGQLLTKVDDRRLERVVVGSSIAGPGKRADAVMRTAGRIRSMAFAEIKHHRTELLSKEYRSGCWAPSEHLAGGVAQVHGTVQRATMAIGERLAAKEVDGSEIPGDFTYLFRPRSFLILGSLDELTGARGGDNTDKIQSFELFRRHLQQPEILTFDELLARAEWLVSDSV